jgi:hypothetical protein
LVENALPAMWAPIRYGLDLLYQIRSWGSEHGGDVPGIIITGLRDPDLESEIRKRVDSAI